MEMEAKQMANEAIKEARNHAAGDLRSQALADVALPPSFEQQQNMQRVMGHKAKKEQRAEKQAELGIPDIKERRREQQAMISMKMDKKKGNRAYNDGSMEAEEGPADGAASSKKKKTTISGSIFRYKDRTGSGDDRYKLPHRKFKEEKSGREKGEASAVASDKKKGTKKSTASFKSKSKFKRR